MPASSSCSASFPCCFQPQARPSSRGRPHGGHFRSTCRTFSFPLPKVQRACWVSRGRSPSRNSSIWSGPSSSDSARPCSCAGLPSPWCAFHRCCGCCCGTRGGHLLEYFVPAGWPDGGGAARHPHSFDSFRSIQVSWEGLDGAVYRDAACSSHGGGRCAMDRVLDVGGGFGLARLSRAVFRSKMASRCPEEPVPRLHRNAQLWAVPASRDS